MFPTSLLKLSVLIILMTNFSSSNVLKDIFDHDTTDNEIEESGRFFKWFGNGAALSLDLSQFLSQGKKGIKPDNEGLHFSILNTLNPFQFWRRGRNTDQRLERCMELEGTLVDRQCFEFFGESKSRDFYQARKFCNQRGGDLWTPNLKDNKLFETLSRKMAQITDAVGFNIWAGARNRNGRIKSIANQDLTDVFKSQLKDGTIKDEQCLVLEVSDKHFATTGKDCNLTDQLFVCEYTIYI